MPSERLAPDAVLSSSNLSGSVSAIQDDPDSPDASWLTASSTSVSTSLAVSFPTPSGNPTGLQEMRVLVRRVGGSNNPTVSAGLAESGVDKSGSGATGTVTVTSATGQIISFTFDASALSDATGAGAELRVTGTASGGQSSKRATVEVGAVEWNAVIASSDRTATGAVAFAAPSLAASGTNTPPAVSGTGAVALSAPSLAATAAQSFAASGGVALAHAALAGSATLSFAGTGGAAIAAPSLAASGTNTAPVSNDVTGTAAVSLAIVALNVTATETFASSGALSVAKPALSATATLSFSASGSVSFSAPSIHAYQSVDAPSGPPKGTASMMGLGV